MFATYRVEASVGDRRAVLPLRGADAWEAEELALRLVATGPVGTEATVVDESGEVKVAHLVKDTLHTFSATWLRHGGLARDAFYERPYSSELSQSWRCSGPRVDDGEPGRSRFPADPWHHRVWVDGAMEWSRESPLSSGHGDYRRLHSDWDRRAARNPETVPMTDAAVAVLKHAAMLRERSADPVSQPHHLLLALARAPETASLLAGTLSYRALLRRTTPDTVRGFGGPTDRRLTDIGLAAGPELRAVLDQVGDRDGPSVVLRTPERLLLALVEAAPLIAGRPFGAAVNAAGVRRALVEAAERRGTGVLAPPLEAPAGRRARRRLAASGAVREVG